MLVTQSFNHILPFFRSEVSLQTFGNLSTDFFHDLHVRSLGDLSSDLNLVSVRRHLLDFVLSNLLIEDLVIELLGGSVNQTVVEFTTMWLHQVHLSWG